MTSVGTLEIDGFSQGSLFTVMLKGAAELRDAQPLRDPFLRWHKSAVEAHAREVRVDVRAVDFMNSTALSAFIGWVAEIMKLADEQRYQIRFEATQKRRWQRSSLHAIACFAPEHVSVSYS
ncbi:MAG: hypothetical protein JNK82_32220 [Myxococcaceae bacterium]|nr:hypothetical protein [Myxococcaceae bacterium]